MPPKPNEFDSATSIFRSRALCGTRSIAVSTDGLSRLSVGGATLWVMSGKKADDYKGVAKFFSFLSRPEVQMDWHTSTGYVPITLAAYEMTRKSGYYEKNPGVDVAINQLNNKAPTANSRGLRFGGFVQGREIFEEEIELVLQG